MYAEGNKFVTQSLRILGHVVLKQHYVEIGI